MSSVLKDLRKRIDECDEELQRLFRERLAIVSEVASYKKKKAQPIYVPQREEEILSRYQGLEREFFYNILRLSRQKQSLVLFPYNIVLIGFMGVGKTSVGELLAHDLGRDFIDLDAVLEKRLGVSIATFFKVHGEASFRKEERILVQELEQQLGLVLGTGGGVVLDPLNVSALQQQGRLVLLTAQKETIYQRLKGDSSRPVLGGDISLETIGNLLKQRDLLYTDAADLTIATDNLTVEEITEQIIEGLFKLEDQVTRG